MSNITMELGPSMGKPVSDFSLPNSEGELMTLDDLMGPAGVILGFIGDIWHATSVRRILWIQHNLHRFADLGTPIGLLVADHPSTLLGFKRSSPLPVPFPMLADASGAVHEAYRMDRHPGLLLIDCQRRLHHKWLMPNDRVWPKHREIMSVIQAMC
jgi:peroxiredoxin